MIKERLKHAIDRFSRGSRSMHQLEFLHPDRHQAEIIWYMYFAATGTMPQYIAFAIQCTRTKLLSTYLSHRVSSLDELQESWNKSYSGSNMVKRVSFSSRYTIQKLWMSSRGVTDTSIYLYHGGLSFYFFQILVHV